MLEALCRSHSIALRRLQKAADEGLGLVRNAEQLRCVELILAGQDPGDGSETVAPIEGTLATRDQHVGDDADAPVVGGRGGRRALDHLGRQELDEGPVHALDLDAGVVLAVQPLGEAEVGDPDLGVVVDLDKDDAEGLEVKVEDVVPVDILEAGADLSHVAFALGLVEHELWLGNSLGEVAPTQIVEDKHRMIRSFVEALHLYQLFGIADLIKYRSLLPHIAPHFQALDMSGGEDLRIELLNAEHCTPRAIIDHEVELLELAVVLGDVVEVGVQLPAGLGNVGASGSGIVHHAVIAVLLGAAPGLDVDVGSVVNIGGRVLVVGGEQSDFSHNPEGVEQSVPPSSSQASPHPDCLQSLEDAQVELVITEPRVCQALVSRKSESKIHEL